MRDSRLRACAAFRVTAAAALMLLAGSPCRADGPADNDPLRVRRVPKLGVEVSAEDRTKLQAGLDELKAAIDKLAAAKNPKTAAILPDVRIYWEAVNSALTYQEFFDAKEIPVAFELLTEGKERAAQLAKGESPWTTATGLVVRGYVSKIDSSVQPYGLVVPDSYGAKLPDKYRLDVWMHGRGETLSELSFLQNRRKSVGQFAPPNAFVLHPYGRYSNANKFAGEVDVLEALEDVKKRYPIDNDRLVVRGFSMGGASTWQLAVHYPTLWAAANPGAGFSETPQFLKSFQKETLNPTWWEEKLWQWYDCDKWAGNLLLCPTIAYSGEKDSQKQAADVMEAALKAINVDLIHVIGPGTGHSYHPDSARDVEQRLVALTARPRNPVPERIQFETFTLKYNRADWLQIDAIENHWEKASAFVNLEGPTFHVVVRNVRALSLQLPPGQSLVRPSKGRSIRFDVIESSGQPGGAARTEPQGVFATDRIRSDRSLTLQMHKNDEGKWEAGPLPESKSGLRKVHDLQGPIDDAFLDSFVFVRPTGKAKYEKADAWARSELDRAIEHWRRHFRGQARVKDDTAITDEEIAGMNLILWGDPSSNALFAKIADKLPIRYDGDKLIVTSSPGAKDERTFDAAHHAPILIYPNPLNPKRYVVLNSSFTFREYAYLNNARQVPMLPDWAIVDLREAPGTVWPGKIADADFFDEQWQVKPPHK